MSRITKEEIEKTKCGRFLLSDENIIKMKRIKLY